MGLLLAQGIEHPFSTLLSSIKYNFYPLIAITIVFIVIFSKKDIGAMAKAEKRTRETGRLLNEGAKPMISDAITSLKPKEGVKPRAFNMVIPLATMVLMMPINLAYTGWGAVETSSSFLNHLSQAIENGSGSSSVLYAVITSIFIAMILYRSQSCLLYTSPSPRD